MDTERARKLSIVIPTFNEEGNIAKLLLAAHRTLQSLSMPHELIVVDDCSMDRTRQIVKNLQSRISEIVLIERDTERGLATAMTRGYDAAAGTYLGSMDADLAHDPKYLEEMIRALDTNTADFVIGSRYVRGARFEGKPILNKLASIIGQFVIRQFLHLTVKDTSNNYRIFRREIWEKIRHQLHPNGNIMLTEIVYQTAARGFRIKEIPIVYVERRIGKSKLSIAKETLNFLKNIVKIRAGKSE